MKDFIITSYTDPVCVWCWATEPVYRALETRYPGQIEFRYVTGGLVRDLDDFEDPDNHISSKDPDFNHQVASHWAQSASIHRMPIRVEGFRLFDQEHPSSYPQNVAYKAAQIASPRLAAKYLRLLRVYTLARAGLTSHRDVQLEIAREAGLDMDAFTRALDDGSAQHAFQTDLALTASAGAAVFPTFSVKNIRAQEVMMRGYNTRTDFENVFRQLNGDTLSPLPSPPDTDILDWLLTEHGALTEEEVVQAFDFASRKEAERWMQGLFDGGHYRKEPAGTSFLLDRAAR